MRSSLVVLSAFLLGACSAFSSAPATKDYTFVWIKTGAREGPLDKADSDRIFGGHFANMERLSREGRLLLAGPYGKQRSDAKLRGVFVLDTADPAVAKTWAESDPGFQASVFRFDYATMSTTAALRAHRIANLATYDAAIAAGRKPAPGEGARGFVWLTAEDATRAQEALAGNEAVLLFARLDGGRALVLLDCDTMTAAVAKLSPLAGKLGPYVLDEWFASGLLTELPKRVDG